MDEVHCVIAKLKIEFARFRIAADKTPLQRLFFMSCHSLRDKSHPLTPIALEGLRRYGNDGAKLQIKNQTTKFIFRNLMKKRPRGPPSEIEQRVSVPSSKRFQKTTVTITKSKSLTLDRSLPTFPLRINALSSLIPYLLILT